MPDLPSYDDLPPATDVGRCGWALFGADDNLGRLNLVTDEVVKDASGLVRRGAMFPLDYPIDVFSPPIVRKRGAPRHTVLHDEGTGLFDDVIDNFYPQASSQWDSLAHYAYAPDNFYGGVTEQQILGGERNTIIHWARHGIATRCVVFDMVRALEAAGRGYAPGTGACFGAEDLEIAKRFAGVDLKRGDMILLHTGFAEWYLSQPQSFKEKTPREFEAPGLAHEEAVLRFLWNSEVTGIAADNIAVEASLRVRTSPFGGLHRHLIGGLGFAIGELWKLGAIADDCAQDGVYEAFLVSNPIHAPIGIGSPANAVAIK